jgi:N,N'-diacetylchitobiose transport system substrate-binding protein
MMKMTGRKGLRMAAVATTAALAATACASAQPAHDRAASPAAPPARNLITTDGSGRHLTVWLTTDAQKTWPGAVAAADKQFQAVTGATVDVVYQKWDGYVDRYRTALAGGSAGSGVPDVVEVGDTDMAGFAADGSLADLTGTKGAFENSSTWLAGLAQSSSYGGKLYGVPYNAGDRLVMFHKNLWSAAGITDTPATFADLTADLDKLAAKYGSTPGFSPMLTPGGDWYSAMAFVYGAGGAIATQSDGQWVGTLESPQARAGLAKWQLLATKYSQGVAGVDEATQGDLFAAPGNKVGAMYGAVWEGFQGGPADVGWFAMPDTAPFAGGSDLAVPAKSANAGLAAEWIKIFTGTAIQKQILAAGAIPNTTTLLGDFIAGGGPDVAMGASIRSGSWVTPVSPRWSDVESHKVLQTMLEAIATGKQTVAAATTAADAQLDALLNGKG